MLFGNATFPLVQPKIIDFFKLQRSIDVSQILNLFKLIIDFDINVWRIWSDELVWYLFGYIFYLEFIVQGLIIISDYV